MIEARLRLQFVAYPDHPILAALVAVEALAGRFNLSNKPRLLDCPDPRKDRRHGHGPGFIVRQLLYARGAGGGRLSNREAPKDAPFCPLPLSTPFTSR